MAIDKDVLDHLLAGREPQCQRRIDAVINGAATAMACYYIIRLDKYTQCSGGWH